MVSLPLRGEIYALNGNNIVAFPKCYVFIDIYMGVMYTCMGFMYLSVYRQKPVCIDIWRDNEGFFINFTLYVDNI